MIGPDLIQGSQTQWKLINRLAEGDAGEVYRVEGLHDRKPAVLKRPRSTAFTPDVQRQASQISVEGRILKALGNISLPNGDIHLKIPALLDTALPGNELSDRFFIIIDRAAGVDLDTLEKYVRHGVPEDPGALSFLDADTSAFVRQVAGSKRFPVLLALRALLGLFRLLPVVHACHSSWMDGEAYGIVWNDVKPGHLFWDPATSVLTVIDWGNGQLLEADGATRDRRYSPADDYRQLFDQMGKFLSEAAPELYADLKWPAAISSDQAAAGQFTELQERLGDFLKGEAEALKKARQQEYELLDLEAGQAYLGDESDGSGLPVLQALDNVQRSILERGELPDYLSTARMYTRVAASMAKAGHFDVFRTLCTQITQLPSVEPSSWELLNHLSALALQETGEAGEAFRQAVIDGMEGDWPSVLWNVCLATRADSDPVRWRSLSGMVRRQAPEVNAGYTPPLVAASRLLQMLEDCLTQLRYRIDVPPGSPVPGAADGTAASLENLVHRLQEDVIRKWNQPDPVPPGADLGYTTLDAILAEVEGLMPALSTRLGLNFDPLLNTLNLALSQPRAQTDIILDAWRARGFKTARLGLRRLLLWDPDRLRLLQVDGAIQEATAWLEEIHHGPRAGEKLQEYTVRMEFAGRRLRSRVGTAHWLDTLSGVFSELRSGKRPGDLLEARPSLSDEFTWLRRYERQPARSRAAAEASKGPAYLFTGQQADGPSKKAREGRIGPDEDVFLGDPLDAWVPEARGSSARVFLGHVRSPAGNEIPSAIKVIRHDKLDYALPLFWEEVQILPQLQDVPGVVRLYECGFFKADDPLMLPGDDSFTSARSLAGPVLRYTVHEADLFTSELEERIEQGWLPYLALERKNNDENLLLHCDEGYTRGGYLDVSTAMHIAVQICEILQSAHERDIVYRDHKIIHYYWNPSTRKVSVIDWNVAKWHPRGVSDYEIHADLVQLGARALHHLFTGRTAPGALPVGPTLPTEIETAPQAYGVSWTYDDQQRLPSDLRDLLSRLLSGEYQSADRLREDLLIQLPHA